MKTLWFIVVGAMVLVSCGEDEDEGKPLLAECEKSKECDSMTCYVAPRKVRGFCTRPCDPRPCDGDGMGCSQMRCEGSTQCKETPNFRPGGTYCIK